MAYWIGIDIGGTNTLCGLVDETGHVERTINFLTEARAGLQSVMERLTQAIEGLMSADGVQPEQLIGVGVGIPGFVNPVDGTVVFNANLGWRNVDFTSMLSERIGVPVFIDNDVRMYVYGEAVQGAGEGFHHVFGITVGTGIAAAMVIEGKLYYGSRFMAGEVGHVPVEGNSQSCGCGLVGCLETVASARGMAREAIRQIKAGRKSVLENWFGPNEVDQITSADLSRAYDLGDSVALDVFNRSGWLLGKEIAHSVMILSPDVIIVGGGGALAGDRLLLPLKNALQQFVYPQYLEGLAVVVAKNLSHAGVVGSALYARNRVLQG